jgi:tetratricopeptide (TPR) repeat protein
VQQLTGDYPAATASLAQSLDLFRHIRHQLGQANALNNLGAVQREIGDHQAAATSLTQALDLFRHLGHRHGQAETLNNLGSLLRHTPGNNTGAIARYQQALSLARDIHAPLEEARALGGLGQCFLDAPDSSSAIVHLEQALSIFQLIGVPETQQVKAALDRLAADTPASPERRR